MNAVAWVPITEESLRKTKVAALIQAARTAALGQGQTDPFPLSVTDVTSTVRANVAGRKGATRLDADPTLIPPSLLALASRMVFRDLLSRLRQPLKPDEQTERDDDKTYLERVARGEVLIETPLNPIAAPVEASGSAFQLVTAAPRRFTRSRFAGL